MSEQEKTERFLQAVKDALAVVFDVEGATRLEVLSIVGEVVTHTIQNICREGMELELYDDFCASLRERFVERVAP